MRCCPSQSIHLTVYSAAATCAARDGCVTRSDLSRGRTGPSVTGDPAKTVGSFPMTPGIRVGTAGSSSVSCGYSLASARVPGCGDATQQQSRCCAKTAKHDLAELRERGPTVIEAQPSPDTIASFARRIRPICGRSRLVDLDTVALTTRRRPRTVRPSRRPVQTSASYPD